MIRFKDFKCRRNVTDQANALVDNAADAPQAVAGATAAIGESVEMRSVKKPAFINHYISTDRSRAKMQETDKGLFLSGLHTQKGYEGHGHATAIMNHAIHYSKQVNKPLELLAQPYSGHADKGRLHNFYKKLGFSNKGEDHFSLNEGSVPKDWKLRDVEHHLKKRGFSEDRHSGGHKIFSHPQKGSISVPAHPTAYISPGVIRKVFAISEGKVVNVHGGWGATGKVYINPSKEQVKNINDTSYRTMHDGKNLYAWGMKNHIIHPDLENNLGVNFDDSTRAFFKHHDLVKNDYDIHKTHKQFQVKPGLLSQTYGTGNNVRSHNAMDAESYYDHFGPHYPIKESGDDQMLVARNPGKKTFMKKATNNPAPDTGKYPVGTVISGDGIIGVSS